MMTFLGLILFFGEGDDGAVLMTMAMLCVCVVNGGEENGDKNRANSFSGNDERSGIQKRKLKDGNER